jgi:S-adenosylmethionine hydrolase
MSPVIVLLTDFGLQDPYVGQMKGALLRAAPQAAIVDLCHEVAPQDIAQAAFLLQASYRHFPDAGVFVAVVDPGVGSGRDILVARLGDRYFLAPDNGLLTFLLDEDAAWWRVGASFPDASRTFHGRDIFAPLAARLASGESPESFAAPLEAGETERLDSPWAVEKNGVLDCRVLHVDRFGNCLLNLREGRPMHPGRAWRTNDGLEIREVQTYSDLAPGSVGLIRGSQGVMELAVNGGSCASALKLSPGSAIRLTRQERP